MIQWLDKNSEIDRRNALSGLSDAVEAQIISNENLTIIFQKLHEMLTNGEEGSLTISDPALQNNIVHMCVLFVFTNPASASNVIQFMPQFQKMWEEGINNPSGHLELMNTIGALFLSLAVILPDFPENILIPVFQRLPIEKDNKMMQMYGNLGRYLETHFPDVPLCHAILHSLIRLFGMDEGQLLDMEIPEELFEYMKDAFKALRTKVPSIMNEIGQEFEEGSRKYQRALGIIQSL